MHISSDSPKLSVQNQTQQLSQKAAELANFGKSLSQAQTHVQQIPAAEEAFKQKFRENKETKRVLGVTEKTEDNEDTESVYEIVQNLKKTLKNLAHYERTRLGL